MQIFEDWTPGLPDNRRRHVLDDGLEMGEYAVAVIFKLSG